MIVPLMNILLPHADAVRCICISSVGCCLNCFVCYGDLRDSFFMNPLCRVTSGLSQCSRCDPPGCDTKPNRVDATSFEA